MVEVAGLAGVSQTTVSLVLNDALGVRLSEQTRQRVLEAARALDYRLVKRGTAANTPVDRTVIGFVVDEISTDPWMALAAAGAREKAWEHGLTLSMTVTRGDPEIEEAALARMAGLPLAGVIWGTIQTREIGAPHLPAGVPAVLLNCYVADRSIGSIVPGEVVGGREATERLLEAGHRRIGFIQGEVWMEASRDRLKGYRQALASREITFDPRLVRPGNWEPSAGFEHTLELMRLDDPPTAIFCSNDLMALGCYEALKEMGKRIPEDIAVIGYDDREIAQFARPPLTTMLLPHQEMGRLAVEHLIEGAHRQGRKPPQIKVECPLVERQSVASPLSEPTWRADRTASA
ncbi:MAG: LacI family DNA-binding transcriptional regulator [Rhizobiaceae bacterium]|nr:LacI family DNA-binding transcriptional regulator [Rhizobiaceae bacterium]